MKKIYFIFFLLISTITLAQYKPANGDIADFKLYPNPAINNKVYISTKENAPKKIFIYDVLGTQVLEVTILGKELNLQDLDAGVYMIRVFEKDKVATRKLIVK